MTLVRVVRVVLFATAVVGAAQAAQRAPADQTPSSRGEVRLVNIEAPDTVAKSELAPHFDVRFFDQPESVTYSSLSFRYGLTSNVEVGVRATTGATRTLALSTGPSLLYGGRDVELFAKAGLGTNGGVRFGALAGVSFPATPAQDQAAGTLGGMATLSVGRRFDVYLNPRAVFLDSNTIVGIGVGAACHISDRVQLLGDWTGIVSGDNTRDVTNGNRRRGDVWGAAVRVSAPSGDGLLELDLGYGNAIGMTTGFSLTPGLGDSGAVYLALRVRR